MLWCFNILLPALLLSPHPKAAEIPSKQTQPLDSSFPLSTSPALLWNHPVKFPGANSNRPAPRPQQRLRPMSSCFPPTRSRTLLLAVPFASCVACSDPLSGTCEYNQLLLCFCCGHANFTIPYPHRHASSRNHERGQCKYLSSHPFSG